MIIIDWVSAADHSSFNESFFFALGFSTKSTFYIFSSELICPGQDNVLVRCGGNRFMRALKVLRICWRNRSNSLLLLTYDPLFAPLLQLCCRRLYVFEHNTTPEHAGLSKHAIWQRLFCRNLIRLAQFPNQMDVLGKLGQRCFYFGSPLRKENTKHIAGKRTVFLAPSWRFQANELLKVTNILGKREVLIKRGSLSVSDLNTLKKELNITPLDWIDLDGNVPRTIAIIVTITSTTRGSGWFNEAIRYGIPLIITNRDVQIIFNKTFPQYPFIDPEKVKSSSELDSQLQEIRNFPHERYVEDYNKELHARFESLRSALDGIPSMEII